MSTNIYKAENRGLRERVSALEIALRKFEVGEAYLELTKINRQWFNKAQRALDKAQKAREAQKAAELREAVGLDQIRKLEDAVHLLRDALDPHAHPAGPDFLEWVAARLVRYAGDSEMESHIHALKRKAKVARDALAKTEKVASPRLIGLLQAFTEKPRDVAANAAFDEKIDRAMSGETP